MKSRRIRIALAIAVVWTAVAAPSQAQRIADVAPGAAFHAPSARTEIAPPATLSTARDLPAALRPTRADAQTAETRRLSVGGHAAVGAGAGAATGALAFLAMYGLSSNCRSADSMCGLAIPFMVGGGAVTGGAVGLVVGLIRNR